MNQFRRAQTLPEGKRIDRSAVAQERGGHFILVRLAVAARPPQTRVFQRKLHPAVDVPQRLLAHEPALAAYAFQAQRVPLHRLFADIDIEHERAMRAVFLQAANPDEDVAYMLRLLPHERYGPPQPGRDDARTDVPAEHMRRLADDEGLVVVFLRRFERADGVLARFQRDGTDMHEQLVFALRQPLRGEDVRDEHVFGMTDFMSVEVNIRDGINALEMEEGAAGFAGPVKAERIKNVACFVVADFEVVVLIIRLVQQACANKVERPVAGNACGDKIGRQVGGAGDFAGKARVVDYAKLPAPIQFQFGFNAHNDCVSFFGVCSLIGNISCYPAVFLRFDSGFIAFLSISGIMRSREGGARA